jgi:hypothetical protein
VGSVSLVSLYCSVASFDGHVQGRTALIGPKFELGLTGVDGTRRGSLLFDLG